ncbi:TspO/MBR family protein [Clostridium hydrogenum]|uniref:TspO/MBR family protein n=1 Tax=Clostridium hydrogenum TaxID=2855764 RepID=UPI002E2EF837|nr:tryptophan-rich sensory protein [Clostridium hydrogenum]
MKNILEVNGEKNIPGLLISIIVTEGIGALSGFIGGAGKMGYSNLKKPFFSPPGYVFPIVWFILYFLMAIAFYRIWISGKQGKDVKKAIILYAIQLGLNFIWSIIFFRFNLYGLAFLELLILFVFILLTTFEFYKIDKVSAYLMIPYIIWVFFAGILNCAVWLLNS